MFATLPAFRALQVGCFHQLRLLRSMRVVKYRKAGRIVYYSLDDSHVGNLLRGEGLSHIFTTTSKGVSS